MALTLRTVSAVIALLLLLAGPVAASRDEESVSPLPASLAPSPASDLRITLGRLLGEHAQLLMTGMRAAADDAADLGAVRAGLDANTRELRDAVASVYGEAAGDTFEPIWQLHIDAAFAWADASQAHDQAAADAAMARMDEFRTTFASFLKSANPKIPADAELHALQLHMDQLTSFLGADFDQAFAIERAAYAHMFDFGDELARGIVAQFPHRYPDGAVAFSPRTTLRLTLGRLLGEHLILAADAMRAGLLQQADAAAAAASIGANSHELSGAIGRVFGADAGTAFDSLWSRHIEAYLAYIDAVRTSDAAGRESALESLHQYHVALAEFLHSAIPTLPLADLETMISHHVSALINQVDATAAGDHVRAVSVIREAYGQMFVLGDALGNGIAKKFPERFGDVRQIPSTNTEPATDSRSGPGTRVTVGPAAVLAPCAVVPIHSGRSSQRLRLV